MSIKDTTPGPWELDACDTPYIINGGERHDGAGVVACVFTDEHSA